jgi:hypothetical protein
LQFAKALISLRLEFRLLRQNHNSNSSSAFSHSLDPKRSSGPLDSSAGQQYNAVYLV